MEHKRGLFDRLRIRRRPPTGPLTTAETKAAEDLRRDAPARDAERLEPKQDETS